MTGPVTPVDSRARPRQPPASSARPGPLVRVIAVCMVSVSAGRDRE
jgi:hypothetical protein